MRNIPRICICVTSLAASQKELNALPVIIRELRTYFEVKVWDSLLPTNMFGSQSVTERIRSLNWAGSHGDIIMPWTGGFNSIELLAEFNSIKLSKSAIFVGYSDNTILANALPALGMCRGWQGPTPANWVKNPKYLDLWVRCLSAVYSEDFYTLGALYTELGFKTYRPGIMEGKIWGGNNYTFDLLQGTPFCPSFREPFILLLEGEDFIVAKERVWQDFIRNLDSIMLLPGATQNIRGLIVGKFPSSYRLQYNEIDTSLRQRAYLQNVPIAFDFPRGYNEPALYLPIGENMRINLETNQISFSKI